MTEDFGEPLGSGPGGLVVPEDLYLNDDPEAAALLAEPAYRGSPEERMERVEALLVSLDRKVQRRFETGERILEAVERGEFDRRNDFNALRGKLTVLTCHMATATRVPEDMARRHELEEVARTQQNEFAFLRESHAWLRGAVTVGLPDRPRRSGVFAWCALWAIATLAVLAAGAVALGLVSVNVSWTGPGLAQTASAVRPAPPRLDAAPVFAEPTFLSGVRGPDREEVAPLVGPPPRFEYLREVEHLDERRAREAINPMPSPGIPGEVEPPPLGKTGEETRTGRGPEEYAGRREDSLGLHPDVWMDAAP